MDKQSEMAVFVRVVDEASFSSAARALKLTPSAISKLIVRLEDRLGARLLNRTTRRLSLTGEGRAYYERCRPILADIEDAERAVLDLNSAPKGLLKINASTAFAQYHVEPLIPSFLEMYPDLKIQLTMSDSLVNLVEEEVDVVIRIAKLPDSTLIARKLAPAKRMVAAAPSYIEKHGMPNTPDDLIHHNCLTLSFETGLNQWEFKGENGPKRYRVDGNFESNNATALHDAALSGLGLIRAANFIIGPDIQAGRLIPVLSDYETEGESNIYAIYPQNRHLSPKVRAFVDLLCDKFLPVPPWEKPGFRRRIYHAG